MAIMHDAYVDRPLLGQQDHITLVSYIYVAARLANGSNCLCKRIG